ncbi:MAG: hypothetical protein ACOY5V_14195 [Pseudomonadota bacterium]|jgi:hypothetical protein
MYGKIFERVFTGSMYGSGPVVFAVWAYVIAHAEPPGVVELNPKYLAGCIGTSREEIQRAIEFLCQPDPESQNKDEDGRRLVAMEGMLYRVTSFQKYREMRSASERREYHRDYWHRRKAQQSLNSTQQPQQHSTNSTKAEAEAEAEAKNPPTPRKRGVRRVSPLFDRFWQAYPRKVNKARAQQAFARIDPDEALLARMLAAMERAKASAQWRKDGGEFIPHAATWLNGRRWEDETGPPNPSNGAALPQINPATGLPNYV